MKQNYKVTTFAAYIGYIVQAVINNLLPLLYVQFSNEFAFEKWQITIIIFISFIVQMLIDSLSTGLVIKLGYRKCTILSHAFTLVGLLSLVFLPYTINSYLGILISVLFMALGGGFIEVLISPIVDAIPNKNKSGSMSLLHSFYSWGHILTILLSTFYFKIFGIINWRWLPFIFIIFPLLNIILFSICPIATQQGDKDPMNLKDVFKMKYFIILFVAILAAGASEISVAQWGSYFIELRLNVDKTLGDLLGLCLFAGTMAISRTIFGFVGDRANTKITIIISAFLLINSYLMIGLFENVPTSIIGIASAGLFVGILWPAIYSVASKQYPLGGTKMFSMLALAGDTGCVCGPLVVGLFSDDIKYGFLLAIIFPGLAFIMTILFKLLTNKGENK